MTTTLFVLVVAAMARLAFSMNENPAPTPLDKFCGVFLVVVATLTFAYCVGAI